MSGRIFVADYDRENVGRLVWLPLGVAAVLGMAGLLLSFPLLSFFAAVFTYLALRNWPLARYNCPALRLSEDGVEVDGLGLVRWRDVSSVDAGVVQVRGLKMPALDIAFRGPVTEVLEPTDASRLRPWEFRIFRLRKDGQLRLNLSKMDDEPDDIQQAFRYFISGQT